MQMTWKCGAAVAALLLLGGCAEQPAAAPSKEPPAAAPSEKPRATPTATKEPKVQEPEPTPELDSRAKEAARQAALAYNEVARALLRGDLNDAQLITGLQEVAVLAMVAGDPLFEAAADRMFVAAQEGDRAGVRHAARVFVGECKRLVPEHRMVTPGDVTR